VDIVILPKEQKYKRVHLTHCCISIDPTSQKIKMYSATANFCSPFIPEVF